MYAQADPSDELAQLHFFSMKKRQKEGDVDFRITVKEFAVPPRGRHMRFLAEADRQVNQKTAPFVPCGWSDTLLGALADCIRLIHEFPYEGEEKG
jgi:hypothetical protein